MAAAAAIDRVAVAGQAELGTDNKLVTFPKQQKSCGDKAAAARDTGPTSPRAAMLPTWYALIDEADLDRIAKPWGSWPLFQGEFDDPFASSCRDHDRCEHDPV
jgi:hypothetical protein